MAGQPGLDLGVLVGGVVVEHDMQLAAWIGASDQLEEAQELTVPVSRVVAGVGHLTGGDLQGGKQGRGAVPDIIVGASLDPARRHRPDRLGAFERLDLGLLVHAEHDRVRRGIQIQPDHVADSRLTRPVGQASGESFPCIALAPGDHGRARDPKPLGDLAVGDSLGG
jgi:hypothetical protein